MIQKSPSCGFGRLLKVKVSYLTSVDKNAKTAFLHQLTMWEVADCQGSNPRPFYSESAARFVITGSCISYDRLVTHLPASVRGRHISSGG